MKSSPLTSRPSMSAPQLKILLKHFTFAGLCLRNTGTMKTLRFCLALLFASAVCCKIIFRWPPGVCFCSVPYTLHFVQELSVFTGEAFFFSLTLQHVHMGGSWWMDFAMELSPWCRISVSRKENWPVKEWMQGGVFAAVFLPPILNDTLLETHSESPLCFVIFIQLDETLEQN